MHVACFIKKLIFILFKMHVTCFEYIHHVHHSNTNTNVAGVEFKFLKLRGMLHVLLKYLLLFYLKKLISKNK